MWYEEITNALVEEDVDIVSYLPDSVIAPLIEHIEADDRFETVPVAREEEAVAILSGAWMGGRRGALICQTSGLANTFNALSSLSKPWGLPFVGIVSRRGTAGEHNLAQVPSGYGMPQMLDAIGIRHEIARGARDVEQLVAATAESAFSVEEPYILLLEATLTGGKQ